MRAPRRAVGGVRSLWRRPSIQASTRCTCGQWRCRKARSPRVAPDLGHGVEVLAVAVVFDHRVGAARVHAARHLARSEDVAGKPVGELARGLHSRPGAAGPPPSSRRRAPSCVRRLRVPGCSAGPWRDIRMWASELRSVSTMGCASAAPQGHAVQAFAPGRSGGVKAGLQGGRVQAPVARSARRSAARPSPACGWPRGQRDAELQRRAGHGLRVHQRHAARGAAVASAARTGRRPAAAPRHAAAPA
jgi:hypothetical protein